MREIGHCADEAVGAPDDASQREYNLNRDDEQARRVGMLRRPAIEAMEPQRLETFVLGGVGLEMAPYVVAVHEEQTDGDKASRPFQFDRQEGGTDGDRIADREVGHVRSEERRVG